MHVRRMDGARASLTEWVREGGVVVVDFWNTRCSKCPAALAKLDRRAMMAGGAATFVACALSIDETDDDASFAQVVGIVDDGAFTHLTHVFMDYATKEDAKRRLGFQTLPFATIYRAGTLVFQGDPTSAAFASKLDEEVSADESCVDSRTRKEESDDRWTE